MSSLGIARGCEGTEDSQAQTGSSRACRGGEPGVAIDIIFVLPLPRLTGLGVPLGA